MYKQEGPPPKRSRFKAQWLNALLASFLGWTLDAFDFFIVVMVLTEIAEDFQKSNTAIALTLSVTLAFRPVGAFLFGLMADRYGRKLPLMIDVLFYSIVEVLCGFAPNFTTFLILRALFGIGMGGEWGVGASLAMESVPAKWRGVLSGLLQEGYAVGYLLAALAYYGVYPYLGWRAMFFLGGLPALLALYIRSHVEESEAWQKHRRHDWSDVWATVQGHSAWYLGLGLIGMLVAVLKLTFVWAVLLGVLVMIVAFMADVTRHVAKGHMGTFFYLVALMAAMNFVSHGTQDLYPTFLKLSKGFSVGMVSLVTIIANIGALAGGIAFGLLSDFLGRKRAMVLALLGAVLIIPLWIYAPTTALIMVGAFLMQFMVQGAWGVIPAHITELSPPSVRGFMPGFAYQCGVLIAGTAATLEALLAQTLGLSKAMALFALAVFLGCALIVAIGREKKGEAFH